MKKLIIIILLSVFCFGFTIQDAHKAVIARRNVVSGSFSTVWNAETATGDSSWTDWQWSGCNGTNTRVTIKADETADASDTYTKIRITFTCHGSSAETIEDVAVGLKGDGVGEDAFDYESGTTPVNVTFNSGSDTGTCPAGGTVTSDAIDISGANWSWDGTQDIFVSVYYGDSPYLTSVSNANEGWNVCGRTDETESTNTQDYNVSGSIENVYEVEGYE